MSDIVKRLRGIRICENFALVEQAADEIESLRSRLADIESQNRVMWDVANDREARLADWHRMADERSAEIVRLSTRLAEAERIVRAVDKVGAEAIANGGRIELTQGAVLFTAAANYLVNCRSASDSASGDEGWGKVCAHCGR